jgi:hypothetical protein
MHLLRSILFQFREKTFLLLPTLNKCFSMTRLPPAALDAIQIAIWSHLFAYLSLSAYIADVDYAPPPSVNMLSLRVLTGYSDATHSPLIRLISPRTMFDVFLNLASNIPSRIICQGHPWGHPLLAGLPLCFR